MPSTYEPIATTTLGSDATSVTFSSISGSYTDLILIGNFSCAIASVLNLRVGNGSIDTGSNYSNTQVAGTGSVTESTRSSNATLIGAGYINGAGRSVWQIHLQNYSNTTTNKTALIRYSTAVTSSQSANARVGLWRSTSAINTVEVLTNGGSQVFETGSTFTLYGIKAA